MCDQSINENNLQTRKKNIFLFYKIVLKEWTSKWVTAVSRKTLHQSYNWELRFKSPHSPLSTYGDVYTSFDDGMIKLPDRNASYIFLYLYGSYLWFFAILWCFIVSFCFYMLFYQPLLVKQIYNSLFCKINKTSISL